MHTCLQTPKKISGWELTLWRRSWFARCVVGNVVVQCSMFMGRVSYVMTTYLPTSLLVIDWDLKWKLSWNSWLGWEEDCHSCGLEKG